MSLRSFAGLVVLVCISAYAAAHEADETSAVAPDLDRRLFEPPEPGSYELPPIQRLGQHVLLDEAGEKTSLPAAAIRQVEIVSFIYRSCHEAGGCPMALAVLRKLDRELDARPELSRRVRLTTVSFDPERDTPARMAELRRLMEPRTDWRFLTAPNKPGIQPVLSDFGQDALRVFTDGGRESTALRHVLKVFLIDGERAVRNIYSAGFLSWEIVMNDIQTILMTP